MKTVSYKYSEKRKYFHQEINITHTTFHTAVKKKERILKMKLAVSWDLSYDCLWIIIADNIWGSVEKFIGWPKYS